MQTDVRDGLRVLWAQIACSNSGVPVHRLRFVVCLWPMQAMWGIILFLMIFGIAISGVILVRVCVDVVLGTSVEPAR